MANFTITRQSEPTDDYGCTEFETNQYSGDTATLSDPNADLDGDIIWYINANPGWTVEPQDFEITHTQEITPGTPSYTWQQYRVFEPDGPIAPVLGITMESVDQNYERIKLVLYLHPDSTVPVSGVPFEMPSNNISTNIRITGCAKLKGQRVNTSVVDGGTGDVEITTSISEDLKDLAGETSSDGSFDVTGSIPNEGEDKEMFSYTIKTKQGERFQSIPNFSTSTSDNYIKSSIDKDDSGNIISTTIKVFKKI
tara:strand:- start:5269 stop:6027 length:759 start_codon:yes stop_codon:yes gene_type:complete